MAANKFASMLHKNCHKIIVILIYAVLEWILILLLLLNSFFSHLIAKFAKFFGLKPSCTWCSRLDHFFDSKGKEKNHHVCEAHGNEISKMSYCSIHNKLAHSKNLCIHCSSSYETTNGISSTVAFFTWMREDLSGGSEEIRCSCCDQIMTAKVNYPHQPLFLKPTWDVLLEYMQKKKAEFEPDLVKKESSDQFQENGKEEDDDQRASEKDDDGKRGEVVEVEEWNSSERADDPFDEDDESVYIADMLLQNAELMDSDRFICIELNNIDAEMAVTTTPEEGIYSVLENEENELQNCDEVEETMKIGHELMSNREEEHEKVMNALYAELEEERKAAAEAAKETMAMITKLQEEKAAIQMEAVQYQRMMEEQAEYDQEALQLLNDLMMKRDKEKREVEKELQMYRDRENSTISRKRSLASSNNNSPSIDLDCYDQDLDDEEMEEMGLEDLIIPDISLAEFDEERVSILEELKALEAKLLHLHDGEDDGDGDGMAKKLLPLFDEEESELVEQDCDEAAIAMKGKMLIEEELGHVYERLQALEADKDFLKHCIRSMIKGDQGMALVHEILQNLRDLKSVELSARKLVDTPLSDASMWEQDHQENNREEMRFSSA